MIKHRMNTYYTIRRYIGCFPPLNFFLTRDSYLHRYHKVCKHSDIVIEGFSRSANTFAVMALREAQKKSINIAHHLHVPAQYIYATKWHIPAIILIRDPIDAVISLVIKNPYIYLKNAFKDYIVPKKCNRYEDFAL